MFCLTDSMEDILKIEKYVKDDFLNCPYLYTNITKYGLIQGKTEIFIDLIDGEHISVALLYYDCLHIYYPHTLKDYRNILELIDELRPRTIFFPMYSNDIIDVHGYHGKKVLVMSPKYFLDIDTSLVKDATTSDIPRISEFMYTHYKDVYESPEVISRQIQERMLDNYGRTKYMECGGNIVACISSYAELDDFAIVSGLLVDESQRGKKLGSIMLNSINKELHDEGKKTCGIIVEDYSRVFHEKNGFEIVGTIIQYKRSL